jgi:hypothetical protein
MLGGLKEDIKMASESSLQQLLSDKWIRGSDWDGFLRYARKNVKEFRGVYSHAELPDDLVGWVNRLRRDIRLLVLGADWCGDVVANIPAVARLCELNVRLQMRILDRDRHEDLMEHFLTNGGKAIPMIIVAPADFSLHRRWGPRPEPCQAVMNENKGKVPKEEIYPMIRDWYQNDRHRTLYRELTDLIKEVSGSD